MYSTHSSQWQLESSLAAAAAMFTSQFNTQSVANLFNNKVNFSSDKRAFNSNAFNNQLISSFMQQAQQQQQHQDPNDPSNLQAKVHPLPQAYIQGFPMAAGAPTPANMFGPPPPAHFFAFNGLTPNFNSFVDLSSQNPGSKNPVYATSNPNGTTASTVDQMNPASLSYYHNELQKQHSGNMGPVFLSFANPNENKPQYFNPNSTNPNTNSSYNNSNNNNNNNNNNTNSNNRAKSFNNQNKPQYSNSSNKPFNRFNNNSTNNVNQHQYYNNGNNSKMANGNLNYFLF
jgi:hypothetical protein